MNYWCTTVETAQYLEIISEIKVAKATGKSRMLIGGTGFGKSNVADLLLSEAEQPHTYVITVSSLYKLIDVINEMVEKLEVGVKTINGARMQHYSLKIRLDLIAQRIKELKEEGNKVQIIFDEGENMNMEILKMLKGFYDLVYKHCSIVVIGTDQLLNKLLNSRKRNRDAIPQLYRRFKAGLKIISAIDKRKEFPKFFKKLGIEDKGLQKLLTDLSDNYGELRDYCEGFLQECHEEKQPICEDFFRLYHDIPAQKK